MQFTARKSKNRARTEERELPIPLQTRDLDAREKIHPPDRQTDRQTGYPEVGTYHICSRWLDHLDPRERERGSNDIGDSIMKEELCVFDLSGTTAKVFLKKGFSIAFGIEARRRCGPFMVSRKT